jgi:serine/threonine protein phosphatase PrpC
MIAAMASRGYGSTHAGQRADNEDWFLMDRALGLYLVADGMGGRAGGEVASRLASETIHGFFRLAGSDSDLGFDASGSSAGRSLAEARMDMAFRLAHREVRRRQVGPLLGMGTTMAALLLRHGRSLIGHVGDSRVYRLRGGALVQLTDDHSFHAEMVAAGIVDRPEHGQGQYGTLITRAIGMPSSFRADIRIDEVLEGDRFLLCTDGLTGAVDAATIATILEELPPAQASPMLVATALTSGARDNVTAVVVEASSGEGLPARYSQVPEPHEI